MPKQIARNAVRLEFNAGTLVHRNLSGAAADGDWLWVAGDEACGLDRLQKLPPLADERLRYGEPVNFPLAELLDLPGEADEEADLEGMALQDGWLWVVGSHGLKRKNAKPGLSDAENAKRLSKLSLDGNRRLLARIPLEQDEHGAPQLRRQTADGRSAARLAGNSERNELTRLLEKDKHFAAYLDIPGKDNGFDIEGLAIFGNRLLLGLRGPVLRGWAGLLEIEVAEKHGELRLAPLDTDGTLYRKHFLNLHGLGVRDLHFDGQHLYLLAGPTMVLDGAIRLYRWHDAARQLANNDSDCRFQSELEQVLTLPHSQGQDRAEAFCAVPEALTDQIPSWLALYDAPSAERMHQEYTVFGDLLQRR